MTDESRIIEAFTMGDCWALALELKKRYPHLTVCTLIDPHWAGYDDPEVYDFMQWSHAVVLDKNTGTYYDVNGAHTDIKYPLWSKFIWEEIYEIPDEDLDEYFADMQDVGRRFSDVSLDDGVRLATVDMLGLHAVA